MQPLSREFLLSRGFCCDNGCLNCPYMNEVYTDLENKTKNMERNSNLYGWIFTYNPFDKIWSATERDNYNALFNGYNDRVLRSANIVTLQEIINKTAGDKNKIKKLLKTK